MARRQGKNSQEPAVFPRLDRNQLATGGQGKASQHMQPHGTCRLRLSAECRIVTHDFHHFDGWFAAGSHKIDGRPSKWVPSPTEYATMTFAVPFFRFRMSFSLTDAASPPQSLAGPSPAAIGTALKSQHDNAFRRQRNRWPAVTLGGDDPDLLRHRYLLGLNL